MQNSLYLEKNTIQNKLIIKLIQLGGLLFNTVNYRIFAMVAKICAQMSGKNNFCSVEVLPDTFFIIDLGDFYWNRLVYKKYIYEPEIYYLLDLFKNTDYLFLDCGANHGFFSG